MLCLTPEEEEPDASRTDLPGHPLPVAGDRANTIGGVSLGWPLLIRIAGKNFALG